MGHRYCLRHKAEHMRVWRRTHRQTPIQRKRANARSYAKVYLKRGKLEKQPCEKCGEVNSQMHHPDYSEPLRVVWLCRHCHLKEHGYLQGPRAGRS